MTTILSIKIATGNNAIVYAVLVPPVPDDIVIPTNILPITPIVFLIFLYFLRILSLFITSSSNNVLIFPIFVLFWTIYVIIKLFYFPIVTVVLFAILLKLTLFI